MEQKESLESGGEYALEPRVVACIVRAYRGMSRAEIEKMLLGGSAQPENKIFASCLSRIDASAR